TMPELGESITEGTITRWIKQEGDRVEADEPLFEVSTDKVDTEGPSPVAGVVKTIKGQADETVEVGAELAIIDEGSAGEATEGEAEDEPEPEPEAEAEAEGAEGGEEQAESGASEGEEQAEGAAEREEGSEEAGGEEEREAAAAEETSEQPKAQASGDDQTTTVTMPELGESITEGTIT